MRDFLLILCVLGAGAFAWLACNRFDRFLRRSRRERAARIKRWRQD